MWWVIGGLVFAYFVYWNFFTKSEPRIYSSIPTSDLTRFLEVLRDRGFDGGRLVVVPSGKRVDAPLQVVVRVPDKTSQPQFELHVPLGGAWLQDSTNVEPALRALGWEGETRVSDDVLRIGAGTDLATVKRVFEHLVQPFRPGADVPIDFHFEDVSLWKRR